MAKSDTGVAEKAGFVFGTKGETLAQLSALIGHDPFCDQIIVPVPRWRQEPDAVLDELLNLRAEGSLAVRSSAAGEDGSESSMAGRFESHTGIARDRDAVNAAIERVIESYGAERAEDQVLVQLTVDNVAVSGVVVTRDLDTGGPYYVVNYDDFSGRTDTVTGGALSKTILVHRSNPEALHSTRFRKLIDIIRRIENATKCEHLDIEFCITRDEDVRILQVRPLAAKSRWQVVPDAAITQALGALRAKLEARMAAPAGVAGATTILGEMPDWNPAEMIGNTPRPLALSLYKTLITDDVWWRARANMGYRSVRFPLMTDLAGRPYIDVRLSLNSFLPGTLDQEHAEEIVGFQLQTLANNRDFHDKIEFEIAATCLDFDFSAYGRALSDAGVGTAAINALAEGLHRITNRAVVAGAAGIREILTRTARLSGVTESTDETPIKRAAQGLAACGSFGTLPFSELARHGFIGVALLRSLVRRGAIAQEDYDRFLNSIETVAGKLVRDMSAVSRGETERDAFLAEYGHLRPGTYDVLSSRYDERPDLYLGNNLPPPVSIPAFVMPPKSRRAIAALLEDIRLDVEVDALLDYVVAAISAREECKFIFTRTLSDSLRDVCLWGEGVGLSRDEISFLTLEGVFDDWDDIVLLREQIAEARTRHLLTRAIRLPDLIAEPDDIDVVRLPMGKPNFITNKSVTGFISILHANHTPDIGGRIVAIESADPGFDWIFSHPIVGLLTKYGGANSHMAIRCAEFGLPAAIGCGEKLFNQLAQAQSIALDCGARVVRAVGGPERNTGK